MVELVDTPDLGSGAERRVGSSPTRRTMSKKEIRHKFRTDVFKRDNYTCQICGYGPFKIEPENIFDAHHITDRSLMPNGGYVKENGITLCKDARPNLKALLNGKQDEFHIISCHMRCEKYHISEGENWEDGLHPNDLYNKINSTLELAIEKSKQLK